MGDLYRSPIFIARQKDRSLRQFLHGAGAGAAEGNDHL